MRKSLHILLIPVLGLFFPHLFHGKVFSSWQFTITNGLSSNSITAIYQDSKGFVWIGTEDGLNKYYGEKFEEFKHVSADESTISGNCIMCITEDLKGQIWIGTKRGGVSVYNRETGKFRSYHHNPENSKSIPDNDIYGFNITRNGEIWIKTENFLSRYNPESDDFTSFGHFSNLFKRTGSISYPVVSESDSTFLVGTKDGINRFYIKSGLFERLFVNGSKIGICSDLVSQIVAIGNNNYMAATHSGLVLFEPKVRLLNIPSGHNPGSKLAVNTVFADKMGNVWVGTRKGLEMFNSGTLVHDLVKMKQSDDQSVVPFEVTSIIEDASGLIWVGTRFNGLFKISVKPLKFRSIGGDDFKYWPLKSFNIQSVFADADNIIWAGTLTHGVYAINRKNKSVKNYILNSKFHQNEDDAVFSITSTDNGSLWFGTNSGIYILDRLKGVIEEFHYGYDAKFATLLKNNRVFSILRVNENDFWFGTQFGLYRLINGRMVSFFKAEENNLVSDYINVLLFDGDRKVWIGTDEGLCSFDLTTGLFDIPKLKNKEQPLKQQILSLAMSGKDKIYIGTRSGFFEMEINNDDGNIVRSVAGMKNRVIKGIIIDGSQNVWLSTGKGISFILPDGTVQNFDVLDGIPDHILNQGSIFKTTTGELLFGSVNGLCWLHPDSIEYNLNLPQIAITGISLCQKGICDEVFADGMDKLEMKYKPGMILEVNIAALEFTQPQKNHYRVMLAGYDHDWRPVTNSNLVTFPNLLPGKYTLKIMGSNSDLTWNNQILEFPIVITPPLWMTGYAYAFYILLLVFVIQLFINYRIRHYKMANRALKEKAQEKKQVEAQKETLTRINRNLTDSITYATRIQSAMIPTEKRLRDLLPKSFVYFRPRDLVSGDFYYVHNDGKLTYLAVVDCTGHGVPGAFMSIIGMELIKNVIEGKKNSDPATILKIMGRQLEETFTLDDSDRDEFSTPLRDGMDVGLCVIDHKNEWIDYSGAVNDLYIVRNNEILAYKGGQLPLGRYRDSYEPEYETIRIPLQKDDMVYLFSDGYVDQFGGNDLKKFKYRRFRHLLLNIHRLNTDDQKAILHQKLEEWKGQEEQVDDILVVGFAPFNT